MTGMNAPKSRRKGAALLAIAIAAVMPLAALAETTNQESGTADATAGATVQTMPIGRGSYGFTYGGKLDTSSLTDAQKAAYDSAVTLYEQVEDAVLSDLVSAGVLAQTDVDHHISLRAAQKALSSLVKTSWTAQQYKAYYEANAKTGDEREAAMQALAESGQLTQDQADALSAQGQSGLWAKLLQNAGTNTAIQTAFSTLRQANSTFIRTLQEAGIQGLGREMMPDAVQDGFSHRQGMDRNNNGAGNKPQGGHGNRK